MKCPIVLSCRDVPSLRYIQPHGLPSSISVKVPKRCDPYTSPIHGLSDPQSALTAPADRELFREEALSKLTGTLALQRGLDSYIKKKKLDSLESYIPAILVAQGQLQEVPTVANAAGVMAARELLRGGAFTGLRDNVRAIAEYLEPKLGKETTKQRVESFFVSLERVDNALFLAIRGDGSVPANLDMLVANCDEALAGFLAMVPDNAIATGKEMVDVLQGMLPAAAGETSAEAEQAAKRLSGLL